jgi:serine/threonine-protein kinase
MLFEMLTGEQPFQGEQPMQVAYQHANDQVPLPSVRVPSIPDSLDQLVRWSTERDPEKRPADARRMHEQLQAVEKEILGETRSATTQQTMVMPATTSTTAEETRVIPRSNATGESPVASLALLSTRRRRRAVIVLISVILVAALAGGLGWFFGAGPGALVGVPRTAGMSPEQATTLITSQGFTTTTDEVYSIDIPLGMVVDTTPAGGTQAPRGSEITVLISLGPKIIPTPVFIGLTEAEATALAEKTGFVVGTPILKFSGDSAKDTVMLARGSDGNDLGETYPEGGTVVFVVSAGPLPDVTNAPQADGFATLQAAGLKPIAASEEFSDTIAKGNIVRVDVPAEGLSPGDSVNVVISKGEDLVAVPDVMGKSISEAAQILQAAGFGYSSNIAPNLQQYVPVITQDPASGNARRGSTIVINGPE